MTQEQLFQDIGRISQRSRISAYPSVDDAYLMVLLIHADWFAAHPMQVSEDQIRKAIQDARLPDYHAATR